MRISLKHTILLSTALVSMNVSVMATEINEPEKVITSFPVVLDATKIDASSNSNNTTTGSVVTETKVPALDLPSLNETVAASDSVVYTFLEDLGLQQNSNLNKTFDQTLKLLEIESYDFLDQQYIQYLNNRTDFSAKGIIGIQTSWGEQTILGHNKSKNWSLKNPESNIINEVLFDEIYSLTGKNASEAILNRFNKINATFSPIIEKLNGEIDSFKVTDTNEDANQIITDSKEIKIKEKKSFVNNLKKLTFDLIVYRKSILDLLALKNKRLVENSEFQKSISKLGGVDKLNGKQQAIDNIAYRNRQIENINKEIQAIECFMRCKYPFSRNLKATAWSIAAALVTGSDRSSKSARESATGFKSIPESLYIAVTFESKLYLGIDSDILKISKDFLKFYMDL